MVKVMFWFGPFTVVVLADFVSVKLGGGGQ
jgi:hypothetical protein